MMKYIAIALLSIVFCLSSKAQFTLTGKVNDAADNSLIGMANVVLTPLRDSVNWKATQCDETGKFIFNNLESGPYKIKVSYIGYKAYSSFVRIQNENKDLGILGLEADKAMLAEVNITEKQTRVEQKQDTTEYNANAYKVNRDANAEDLVTKMPGIVNENGKIKAQGEEVKKVTIDGKDFFGTDVTTALRNLPAEIVDRTQVFDRMSDQSQFTGFDDGNSQKSMNIVTKSGMNQGLFGKVYGGFGYINEPEYSTGGNLNWFEGDRRVSLLYMSNNVNAQNFSPQDLAGVMGSSGGGMGFGGMGGGRRGPGGGGQQNQNNFSIAQQSGISTTHATGINYIDTWGKRNRLKVTGSYFFNYSENNSLSALSRQYFSKSDTTTFYNEGSNTNSVNINHRGNFRFQFDIDSSNSVIISPRFTTQQNKRTADANGNTSTNESLVLSNTNSLNKNNNFAYNVSSEFLYRHKFKTRFRTLSFSVTPSINNRQGVGTLNAYSYYSDDSTIINQETESKSSNYAVAGNVSYTEPAGKSGMVQLSYDGSVTWAAADKTTSNIDSANSTLIDTALSNLYSNIFMLHKIAASYKVNLKKANVTVGVAGQYATLNGNNTFPNSYTTDRQFYNVLPNFTLNYKFSSAANMRLMYRTSTNAPSIAQLQSVIDNSNPLILSTGNAGLKQSVNHFVMTRFSYTNPKTAQSFFAFLSYNFIQDYIGNSTYIAASDTILEGNVTLKKGAQVTSPFNINGNMSANSFFTYSMPITAIKCNLNLNTGFTYTRTPGQINFNTNYANTYNVNGGLVLSSNISEKIDFSINYMANYNIVKNTLQTGSNNNYFTHNAGLRFNWLFWKGFVFNTNVQNTLYTGIAQGYNQNIVLWNMALGYKFLTDKSLELRASVNDILNQNNGISRTVTDTYVEDSSNKILQRYYLVTLTYNFRVANLKKKK